tara:strand:- start:251 stop:451 length:201 start_codon:yes stop_codon:yes gene_type:complete
MIEQLEAYESALRHKEEEVHGLRMRIKELVSVVSDLKKELTTSKLKVNLVSENPDASHITKREKDD